MPSPTKALSQTEFVILLALMTSIMAMSTDVMLPALQVIGEDLKVTNPNTAQFVLSSLFIGFAAGQIIAGPLSDSFGRKPVIYAGYVIFIAGCLLSIFATSFTMMIVGRILQGFGGAAPRTVAVALVRDGYEGRGMARIMSIIMSIFILVPMIAPAIGQGAIALGGWRATFILLLALALIAFIWFALRQPETLIVEHRRKFSVRNVLGGIAEVFRNRTALGFTTVMGLIFGAFFGYLSSAPQIFDVTFGEGELFVVYFAVAALAIGLASLLNARLVMRFGMHLLTRYALALSAIASIAFLIPVLLFKGTPPFLWFMIWIIPTFFCLGILFGNLNALAMEPLGHLAGLGSAMVGSISTFIAMPLGWFIGIKFDGGITSLVSGFAILCTISWLWFLRTERITEPAIAG